MFGNIGLFLLFVVLTDAYKYCADPLTVYNNGCYYNCYSSDMRVAKVLLCENDAVTSLSCNRSRMCPQGQCNRAWCYKDKFRDCNSDRDSFSPVLTYYICQDDAPREQTTTIKAEPDTQESPDIMKIIVTVIFAVLGVVLAGLLIHRSIIFFGAVFQRNRENQQRSRDEDSNTFQSNSLIPSAPPVHPQAFNVNSTFPANYTVPSSLDPNPPDDPPPYSEHQPPPYTAIIPHYDNNPESKGSLV